ncbi:MAG: M23 family metallopeptidase [Ardenticatenia bacterium]|nr:M23 family metallopeptidase [Ardenticatenia bacterium]
MTGHIILLVLIVAGYAAAQVQWQEQLPDFSLPSLVLRPARTVNPPLRPPMLIAPNTVEQPPTVRVEVAPWTTVVERPAVARTEPVIYIVQPGDNPSLIASRFGLKPETIIWANAELERTPDLLSVGQELIIPPVDGVLHTVKKGDTLESIAKKYKVSVEAIVGYEPNGLAPGAQLAEGQKIMVPGGKKPYVAPVVRAPTGRWVNPGTFDGASGAFMWPITGRITQGVHRYHMALDIANAMGMPIAASDAGVVIFAGWDNSGYGYSVVIDHGNGFRTRYAHMSYYLVQAGDKVNKGDIIGKVGSTGRSTGPHLHFEIIYQGVRRNPYNFLP